MAGAIHQRSFGDYLDLLAAFNNQSVKVLIVGGQAVNFWAEAFQEEEPELLQFQPFTSSDLDLHLVDAAARTVLRRKSGRTHPQSDPFGKAFTIVSQTFFVQGADGHTLPVDDLKMVAGLRPVEVKKGSLLVEFAGVAVSVLNPICCFKAKFYNVRTLDQRHRQDLKHARMLILCVRAFLRRLLKEGQSNGNYRPALNALKQVLLGTAQAAVVKTARAQRIDLTQCLPLAELERSIEPRIVNFVSRQLPKWAAAMR